MSNDFLAALQTAQADLGESALAALFPLNAHRKNRG